MSRRRRRWSDGSILRRTIARRCKGAKQKQIQKGRCINGNFINVPAGFITALRQRKQTSKKSRLQAASGSQTCMDIRRDDTPASPNMGDGCPFRPLISVQHFAYDIRRNHIFIICQMSFFHMIHIGFAKHSRRSCQNGSVQCVYHRRHKLTGLSLCKLPITVSL